MSSFSCKRCGLSATADPGHYLTHECNAEDERADECAAIIREIVASARLVTVSRNYLIRDELYDRCRAWVAAEREAK